MFCPVSLHRLGMLIKVTYISIVHIFNSKAKIWTIFFVHFWPFVKMHLNFYIQLINVAGIKSLENIQEILNA